ncbi:MAG: isoprenylcysteine carboxylmethyltransferase family protein [Gemmatimonadota bacterium]
MKFLWIALRAVVYMAAFVSFFGLIALSLRGMDAQLGVELPAALRTPGAVLMTAGAALVLFCGLLFVSRGEGTPAPFDPPRKFVAHGPYLWVRNPMQMGALVLLLGFGLWNLSVSIVLFSVVMGAGIHLFVVLVEEPGLAVRFGSDYEEYRASVNRWVPAPPQPNESRP